MAGSEIILQKGILLLSAPLLNDIFKRSVILLTEHSDEGSVGLILNKQSDYKLSDVIEDFPEFDSKLYIGGPVQQDMLNFIHRSDSIPGGVEVSEDVFWGGEFESLKALIESGSADPDDFRFILGYAGWGPGQLKSELDSDSWYPARCSSEYVFPANPSDLWGRVMRKMGSKYAYLSTFPDDPSMN